MQVERLGIDAPALRTTTPEAASSLYGKGTLSTRAIAAGAPARKSPDRQPLPRGPRPAPPGIRARRVGPTFSAPGRSGPNLVLRARPAPPTRLRLALRRRHRPPRRPAPSPGAGGFGQGRAPTPRVPPLRRPGAVQGAGGVSPKMSAEVRPPKTQTLSPRRSLVWRRSLPRHSHGGPGPALGGRRGQSPRTPPPLLLPHPPPPPPPPRERESCTAGAHPPAGVRREGRWRRLGAATGVRRGGGAAGLRSRRRV